MKLISSSVEYDVTPAEVRDYEDFSEMQLGSYIKGVVLSGNLSKIHFYALVNSLNLSEAIIIEWEGDKKRLRSLGENEVLINPPKPAKEMIVLLESANLETIKIIAYGSDGVGYQFTNLSSQEIKLTIPGKMILLARVIKASAPWNGFIIKNVRVSY